MPQPPLVLASTSRYRRELLSRLVTGFATTAPDTDESAIDGETPATMAQRLATEKALAVAARHPGAVVIGSDQVAELDGQALGKPGNHEAAHRQLAASSGRELLFHTAVHVITADGRHLQSRDVTRVRFRQLSDVEIERYLQHEQPYDCAGSFKSEGLGIALFETISSQDPTALIGLPLIATAQLLRQAGIDPLRSG